MKVGEGWYLDNGGNPPFVARDDITQELLPVRKHVDIETGEAIFGVIYKGIFKVFHVPEKLVNKKENWQTALKMHGTVAASVLEREITEMNKIEIIKATTHVSGPDKVEPRKIQIREL